MLSFSWCLEEIEQLLMYLSWAFARESKLLFKFLFFLSVSVSVPGILTFAALSLTYIWKDKTSKLQWIWRELTTRLSFGSQGPSLCCCHCSTFKACWHVSCYVTPWALNCPSRRKRKKRYLLYFSQEACSNFNMEEKQEKNYFNIHKNSTW